MDGCHRAFFDTELVVQHFGYRCQTVGAAGVADDMMIGVIVFVFVDAHYSNNNALARGEMMTFLAPPMVMCTSAFLCQRKAGRFYDILDAVILQGCLVFSAL